MRVGSTRHPRHRHPAADVVECLAEVDSVDGDVGAALPWAVLRTVVVQQFFTFSIDRVLKVFFRTPIMYHDINSSIGLKGRSRQLRPKVHILDDPSHGQPL